MNTLAIMNHSLSFQERKEVMRHLSKVKQKYPLLQHNLYEVEKKREENQFITIYTIVLNPESEIYKVHFPEQPLTPGSCLVEIAKELIEDDFGKTLNLKMIVDLNYFNPINPNEFQSIDFIIEKIEKELKISELDVIIRVKKEKEQFALMQLSFDKSFND